MTKILFALMVVAVLFVGCAKAKTETPPAAVGGPVEPDVVADVVAPVPVPVAVDAGTPVVVDAAPVEPVVEAAAPAADATVPAAPTEATGDAPAEPAKE